MSDKEYLNKLQEIKKDDLIKELETALASNGFVFDELSPSELFIYFRNSIGWRIAISLTNGDILLEDEGSESVFMSPYLITAFGEVNKIVQHWIHTIKEEQ